MNQMIERLNAEEKAYLSGEGLKKEAEEVWFDLRIRRRGDVGI